MRILHSRPALDGATLSRPRRGRLTPAVLRGRYRTAFFALLALIALATGHQAAAFTALLAAVVGVGSVRVAHTRGPDLAYSFIVVDWLLLGCVLALSGGATSWLLGGVPILALGQLAGAPRDEWPYLITPAVLLIVVLAIADPSLAGSRAAAIAKITLLCCGGWIAATRLKTRPAGRRRATAGDPATEIQAARRLRELLRREIDQARARGGTLSVATLRLPRRRVTPASWSARDGDLLARTVAHHIDLRLSDDDRVFHVAPGSFVLVLPGRSRHEASALVAAIAGDVGDVIPAAHARTLATGVASFPEAGSDAELLAAARPKPRSEAGRLAATPAAAMAVNQ